MFKIRTLVLFGIAVILALAATWLARRWVTEIKDPSRHFTPVVVAARDIAFLSPVGEADLKVIQFPKGHAPGESLTDVHQAIGKIVTQAMQPGEVILQSRLRDHMSGSLLAHTLPSNTRAVSVRVNDVSGVGGFILPGSLVDVLVSRKVGSGQAATETIVHAVKVMAVGQETSAEKQSPMLVQVVTLELSPADAERVVQATVEGTVHLILRNPADHSIYPIHPVERPQPARSQSAVAAAPAAELRSNPKASEPAVKDIRAHESKGKIAAPPDHKKDLRQLIKGNKDVWMECTPNGCVDATAVPKSP